MAKGTRKYGKRSGKQNKRTLKKGSGYFDFPKYDEYDDNLQLDWTQPFQCIRKEVGPLGKPFYLYDISFEVINTNPIITINFDNTDNSVKLLGVKAVADRLKDIGLSEDEIINLNYIRLPVRGGWSDKNVLKFYFKGDKLFLFLLLDKTKLNEPNNDSMGNFKLPNKESILFSKEYNDDDNHYLNTAFIMPFTQMKKSKDETTGNIIIWNKATSLQTARNVIGTRLGMTYDRTDQNQKSGPVTPAQEMPSGLQMQQTQNEEIVPPPPQPKKYFGLFGGRKSRSGKRSKKGSRKARR